MNVAIKLYSMNIYDRTTTFILNECRHAMAKKNLLLHCLLIVSIVMIFTITNTSIILEGFGIIGKAEFFYFAKCNHRNLYRHVKVRNLENCFLLI